MGIEEISEEGYNELTYTIQNIVVKSSFQKKIDLDLLFRKTKNSNYNAKNFPGLFMRFLNPKCVVIIFKNGNIILTGLIQFNHINIILEKLISKLNREHNFELDIDINSVKTEVVNIVITANYYRRIDLNLASLKLENAMYEPEIFPGIIYKIYKPFTAVFLIFSTGKVVLTGIKNEDFIEIALVKLGKKIKKKELFNSN